MPRPPVRFDANDHGKSGESGQVSRLTRERILKEIEGSGYISGPHFPDVRFGRVLIGEGIRLWN